jgi:hypothetical protein
MGDVLMNRSTAGWGKQAAVSTVKCSRISGPQSQLDLKYREPDDLMNGGSLYDNPSLRPVLLHANLYKKMKATKLRPLLSNPDINMSP